MPASTRSLGTAPAPGTSPAPPAAEPHVPDAAPLAAAAPLVAPGLAARRLAGRTRSRWGAARRRWTALRRDPLQEELKTGTALLQFTIAGVIAMVILAMIGMAALRHAAEAQAIKQAVELTNDRAVMLVQPALTDALVAGDPAAIRAFDQRVRYGGLLGPRVARVKLWKRDGTIIWSDDQFLIGQNFPLAPDDLATLATGKPSADLSNLSAAENKFERNEGQLLQVYDRVTTPSGEQLLFEVYLRFDSITANAQDVAKSVGPAFLLALVALQVLQLPLAWRLIRRIRRGQRERDALHRRVAEASDGERRRIARELHDGVVQSLAGLSFSLAAASEELRQGEHGETLVAAARSKVDAAAAGARRNVGELRNLITEIHPPDLEGPGLGNAIAELLVPLSEAGITTSLRMPDELSASRAEVAAVYRATQEGLRNVAAYAGAQTVSVEVAELGDQVSLVVRDDGVGFDPAEVGTREDRPHFGLRLLDGLAREVGGRMVVETAPGQGTTLYLEIPLHGRAHGRRWSR